LAGGNERVSGVIYLDEMKKIGLNFKGKPLAIHKQYINKIK
jgi:hypothetical protein